MQVGAVFHQQLHSGGHGVLLALLECLPPLPELVRVLDLPRDGYIIFQVRNQVQGVNDRFRQEHESSRARAQPHLTGREIRGDIDGVILVYMRSHGAASCRVDDFVAEIGVDGGILLNRSKQSDSGAPSTVMGQSQLRNGESRTWTWGTPEDGSVSRSIPVLVLRRRPGRSCGPGRLPLQVGAGDDAGQDAQPTPDRLALLGGAVWRFPLRLPAIGGWSPRQLVPLSAVCCDASGRCSRKRVCTIATRNKTSHSSAHGCGALQAVPPWLCAGMRGAIGSPFFGLFRAVPGVYRSLSLGTEWREA